MAKHRSPGDGSIYRRADGRWCAAITLDTGKKRVVYGKTRAEAVAKLADLQHQRGAGLSVAADRQMLADFLGEWLAYKRPSVDPASYREYERAIALHVTPALGRTVVGKLTPARLQRFYGDLGSRLAASTVHKIHNGVVFPALELAVRWGLAARNVAALVQLPKVTPPSRRSLSRDEARAFVAAIAGDRLEALYLLAITTGLRQGELLGLRWADLDLPAGIVSVRQQYKRAYTGRTMGAPKSAAGIRRVALTPLAVEALRRHRAAQLAERLAAGPLWPDRGLVFVSPRGRAINPAHLRDRLYYPLLARHRLPRLLFHELRHSAATILLAAGVPMPVVSRLLGHANIRVTVESYGHIAVEDQAEAVEAMRELLGP